MSKLTLYHSTTDYYLPSIKLLGLGGDNPNKSNGILEFLRALYHLCEQYLIDNEAYLKIQYSTHGMVNQSIKGCFNFRHDRTYLSINESTAIRYSMNKYGSELLSRSIFLYDLLMARELEDKLDTSMLRFDLKLLLNAPHNKLLLKVKDIDPNDLETETGEDMHSKLREIENLKKTNIKVYNVLSQQFNFALKRKIDINNIDVFQIELNQTKSDGIRYKLIRYNGQ